MNQSAVAQLVDALDAGRPVRDALAKALGDDELGVFYWLNGLFLRGYSQVLAISDLYPLDSALRSQSLHDEFSKHLDYSKLEGDKFALLKALLQTLRVPLLLPVVPRMAKLGFIFCQPFFIERLLHYLSEPDADPNAGYGLIAASMLIYMGIAISDALYQ